MNKLRKDSWYVPLRMFATKVASCARAAKVNAVTLKLGMETLIRVCVLTGIGTKHRWHRQCRPEQEDPM
jgi:hypothetical protein